jgi:uncharacterized protein (DUF302 family)
MRYNYIITTIFLVCSYTVIAQNTKKVTSEIMIESVSNYGFEETINKLTESLTGKNWKLITTHNMQETMKKNGKEIARIKIMELCNPEIAYSILSVDAHRSLSPMLPCRVSIYEKADGKTYISRMNIPLFADMIDEEASQSVMKAYRESEDFIKVVIE